MFRPHAAHRRGYTLVELLMALAVIAVLVGVTVPGALRMYADSRLSEAAESVRMQLAGSRARSIEGGLVYQFRYEPDGAHFVSAPFEREIEPTSTGATGTGVTTGIGRFSKFGGQLPKGFKFVACCTNGAMGGQIPEQFLDGLPNAGGLSSIAWSPPIVFSPDGRGTDAAFELQDSRKQVVRFEVRGVTGAVKFNRLAMETKRR